MQGQKGAPVKKQKSDLHLEDIASDFTGKGLSIVKKISKNG